MYLYTHPHTYIYIYRYILIYVYVCIYINTYMCIYVSLHTHSYHHYMHVCVYTYTVYRSRHHVYYVDVYFSLIHSTTHVILDMLANTPGASDLMPKPPSHSQPEVVEHVPSDDSWKAASSDKTQSPNVMICVLTLSLSHHVSSVYSHNPICMYACIHVYMNKYK